MPSHTSKCQTATIFFQSVLWCNLPNYCHSGLLTRGMFLKHFLGAYPGSQLWKIQPRNMAWLRSDPMLMPCLFCWHARPRARTTNIAQSGTQVRWTPSSRNQIGTQVCHFQKRVSWNRSRNKQTGKGTSRQPRFAHLTECESTRTSLPSATSRCPAFRSGT